MWSKMNYQPLAHHPVQWGFTWKWLQVHYFCEMCKPTLHINDLFLSLCPTELLLPWNRRTTASSPTLLKGSGVISHVWLWKGGVVVEVGWLELIFPYQTESRPAAGTEVYDDLSLTRKTGLGVRKTGLHLIPNWKKTGRGSHPSLYYTPLEPTAKIENLHPTDKG